MLPNLTIHMRAQRKPIDKDTTHLKQAWNSSETQQVESKKGKKKDGSELHHFCKEAHDAAAAAGSVSIHAHMRPPPSSPHCNLQQEMHMTSVCL